MSQALIECNNCQSKEFSQYTMYEVKELVTMQYSDQGEFVVNVLDMELGQGESIGRLVCVKCNRIYVLNKVNGKEIVVDTFEHEDKKVGVDDVNGEGTEKSNEQ